MRDTTIFDVANWFLLKEPMSHKKLQKLSYYYKAWGLALYNEDMMPGFEFMAWIHGPVNRQLYDKYHGNGWNDISISSDIQLHIFSKKEEELLESVWETYGDKSANELEAQTHIDMPWRIARGTLGEWDSCNEYISHESMRDFYRSVYIGAQGD